MKSDRYLCNPLYLPAEIAKEHDQLWTPDRLTQVIDAAAKNRLPLRLIAKLYLPKVDFIQASKKAGIKFTFVRNNGDANIGRLEYCLRMVRECGLTREDVKICGCQSRGTKTNPGTQTVNINHHRGTEITEKKRKMQLLGLFLKRTKFIFFSLCLRLCGSILRLSSLLAMLKLPCILWPRVLMRIIDI